jgi:hypothetical protein
MATRFPSLIPNLKNLAASDLAIWSSSANVHAASAVSTAIRCGDSAALCFNQFGIVVTVIVV